MTKEITQQVDTHLYLVPKFKVSPKGLEFVEELVIPICKGAKGSPVQTGVLTQDLIRLCISYYKDVNIGEMSTKETSVAITKLEEALM